MKAGKSEKLTLSSIGLVILGVALLAGSSDEYRRNAAFAFDSYGGSCPVYEGGRCYQQSGIACYEVDCGVDEDITVVGTSTPVPLPTDLMEPVPAETDVTPNPSPSSTVGQLVNVSTMNRQQLKAALEYACNRGRPVGEGDPDTRERILGDGIRSCLKAVETRPNCRWLLGPGYYHPISMLGRFGQDYNPLDPVNLLRSFGETRNFRDPGVGFYNMTDPVIAYTPESFQDTSDPIVVLDPFFGWTRPLVECGSDRECSDAELRAQVDNVYNRGQKLSCSVGIQTEQERAMIVCHEIGHRSRLGRHVWESNEDYNSKILDECFL